jgi:hypothetical protein
MNPISHWRPRTGIRTLRHRKQLELSPRSRAMPERKFSAKSAAIDLDGGSRAAEEIKAGREPSASSRPTTMPEPGMEEREFPSTSPLELALLRDHLREDRGRPARPSRRSTASMSSAPTTALARSPRPAAADRRQGLAQCPSPSAPAVGQGGRRFVSHKSRSPRRSPADRPAVGQSPARCAAGSGPAI